MGELVILNSKEESMALGSGEVRKWGWVSGEERDIRSGGRRGG